MSNKSHIETSLIDFVHSEENTYLRERGEQKRNKREPER